jgi:hypothetical protein
MRLVILILVVGLLSSMLVGCGSNGPAISEEVYKQRADEQKKRFGIPDDPKEMMLQKQQDMQRGMQKAGKIDQKAMSGPMSGTQPANPSP